MTSAYLAKPFTGTSQDRYVGGGAHNHIFVFTDLENNGFQNKSIT